MRLSELINLKEAQIDKGYSNLKVLGKRNKERIIPINNLLLYPILEYMNAKRNNIDIFDTEYLLINEKEKSYSQSMYIIK